MKDYNNNTVLALTIKKETSLSKIHNITNNVFRISSKAIFVTFALTLLNMVI